ncbi:hypothetical protein AX774_g7235 [Zancudomyces culisetae]|nr:hypothetical protein AX774_g7235 [Zancudomyces culisetae]|eukprot:OMH79354.1 hypothetical protein AX774_g7235 [Zancudomyces culisetae]
MNVVPVSKTAVWLTKRSLAPLMFPTPSVSKPTCGFSNVYSVKTDFPVRVGSKTHPFEITSKTGFFNPSNNQCSDLVLAASNVKRECSVFVLKNIF